MPDIFDKYKQQSDRELMLNAHCERWNASNPLGTPVTVLKDSGDLFDTKTRSLAWVLSGHTAVILVDGIPAACSLDRVKLRGGTKAEEPLRGMYNACVSLQERHLEALRNGDGRGLSTVEMAEHLERESGFRACFEALEAVKTWWENEAVGSGQLPAQAFTALSKARGEKQ